MFFSYFIKFLKLNVLKVNFLPIVDCIPFLDSFSLEYIVFKELENPLILIHDKKISDMNSLVRILELALKVIQLQSFLLYIFLVK